MPLSRMPAEIELLLRHVARRRDGFEFFCKAPLESVAVLFEVPPPVVTAARAYLETPEQCQLLTQALLRARLAEREKLALGRTESPEHHSVRVVEPQDVVEELKNYPAGPDFLLHAPPETLAVLLEVPPSVIFKARELVGQDGP